MKKVYKGFTLAEVLITLAVIGVVSALTIPNIVINYQKRQTIEQLKVGYQMLQEAMNRAIIDHGPMKTWDVSGQYTTTKPYNILNTYFRPYLKVQEYCGVYGYNLNNKGVCKGVVPDYGYAGLVIQNSMAIIIRCGTGSRITDFDIILDINGNKKPNRMGNDRFVFQLNDKNKIIPFPRHPWDRSMDCDDSQRTTVQWRNWSCAHKIIVQDKWEIKDNYPWSPWHN